MNTTVATMEFAPYAGKKKVRVDRSKLLLVEAKMTYDQIIHLGPEQELAQELQVPPVQIMGAYHNLCLKRLNIIFIGSEAHLMTTRNVANQLYVSNSWGTAVLPSTIGEIKKFAVDFFKFLYEFKVYLQKKNPKSDCTIS